MEYICCVCDEIVDVIDNCQCLCMVCHDGEFESCCCSSCGEVFCMTCGGMLDGVYCCHDCIDKSKKEE